MRKIKAACLLAIVLCVLCSCAGAERGVIQASVTRQEAFANSLTEELSVETDEDEEPFVFEEEDEDDNEDESTPEPVKKEAKEDIFDKYGYFPAYNVPPADVAGVKTLYFKQETNDLSVNAVYPETESEAVNKIIEKVVKDDVSSFIRANGEHGILEINYRIFRHSEFIVGFAFDCREFTKEDGFVGSTKTLMFDLIGGLPIPVQCLFTGDEYVDVIKRHAEEQLAGVTNGGNLSAGVLEALKDVGKSGFGRFAFDDTNFYVFIDLEKNGTIETVVPLEEFGKSFVIDNYLAEYFAENETPLENTGTTNNVLVAPTDGKYVAFTFDDGPHATNTPRLLDAMAELDAKGTFFVLGHRIEATADIVKRMADEGHEIGCHSYSHAQLNAIGAEKLRQEVVSTNDLIRQYSGSAPRVMRPPYGELNKRVVSLAREKGLAIFLWGVDPRDWATKDADSVCRSILKQTKNGSIVLVHDIYDSSVTGAINAMKALKEQGYKFVTVTELIELTGGQAMPGVVYGDGDRIVTKWD